MNLRRTAIVKVGGYYRIRRGWFIHTWLDYPYKSGYWWSDSYRHHSNEFKTVEEAEATYKQYKEQGVVKYL